MNISDAIKQKLEKKGFRNLRDASKFLGVSTELLRRTLNKKHIPKDKILILMAKKLGLDHTALILAAHQEKVPPEVKTFFLSPVPAKAWRVKRKFPLSQEQCEYLAKIMTVGEIQMVRKFRQTSDEGKTQIIGYIDYMFATKRKV